MLPSAARPLLRASGASRSIWESKDRMHRLERPASLSDVARLMWCRRFTSALNRQGPHIYFGRFLWPWSLTLILILILILHAVNYDFLHALNYDFTLILDHIESY